MVTKFLVMLATQADDKLQALRFRLDFNEYYQQKEPILASPQVELYWFYSIHNGASIRETNGVVKIFFAIVSSNCVWSLISLLL